MSLRDCNKRDNSDTSSSIWNGLICGYLKEYKSEKDIDFVNVLERTDGRDREGASRLFGSGER